MAHPILNLFRVKTAAQQVIAAGVLEGVAVAQGGGPAGGGAVALGECVEPLAADGFAPARREEGTWLGSAKLAPLFQGVRLLVIQRMEAGTGAVYAVHHEASGLRRIILELEQADL